MRWSLIPNTPHYNFLSNIFLHSAVWVLHFSMYIWWVYTVLTALSNSVMGCMVSLFTSSVTVKWPTSLSKTVMGRSDYSPLRYTDQITYFLIKNCDGPVIYLPLQYSSSDLLPYQTLWWTGQFNHLFSTGQTAYLLIKQWWTDQSTHVLSDGGWPLAQYCRLGFVVNIVAFNHCHVFLLVVPCKS